MFDSLKRQPRPASVMLTRLTRAYCKAMGLEQAQLYAKGRGHNSEASTYLQRWVFWSIARELIDDVSFRQLGIQFGGIDHTTVSHGVRKLPSILAGDPDKANDYAELLELCRRELEAA